MAYAAQHVCSAHTYFVPHHTKEFGEFGVPLPHPPAFRPIRRNNSKKADSITCLYLRACWGASATELAVQCPEAVQCPPAPLARRLCYRVRWRVLAAPPSSLVANGGWPPRLSRCIECCRSCTLRQEPVALTVLSTETAEPAELCKQQFLKWSLDHSRPSLSSTGRSPPSQSPANRRYANTMG